MVAKAKTTLLKAGLNPPSLSLWSRYFTAISNKELSIHSI
jgi:hypothetical protein